MNNFYIKTEANIFCLMIIVFLYFFNSETAENQTKENKLLYYFSSVSIFFSVLGVIVKSDIMQNFCFVVCAFCSFKAAYFGLKLVSLNKMISVVCGAVFGVLSLIAVKCGINAPAYVMTFAVIALFALEQRNKIRVDNLTKLYNRYGMDAELKEQLRQYEREHTDSFYIIACDLDNFKHINDTWGHPEGDRALVLVAGVLSKVGKMFDAEVFRIGGDEFILITDTSEEGLANDITSAIKSELDNLEFRDDFDIKMSIGVALYDGVTAIDDLLNNADKKLYEAKKRK